MKQPSLPNTTVRVSREGLLWPESPDGDDWYGLAMGTNGTAATMRRALLEQTITREGAAEKPLQWVRNNGGPPIGLRFAPAQGGVDFENPWIPPTHGEVEEP